MPMSDKINPLRYPTLYRYIASLPQGIASYPQMQTLADVPASIRLRFPNILQKEDLPADLTAALKLPWLSRTWIPEVHFMALNALVRDVIYKNDSGYLQFCFDTMKESFNSPLMRTMMLFVSPNLLAMNFEKKWNLYKRGSVISSQVTSPTSRLITLKYPERIYLPCMLAGFGKSIEAGLACTRVASQEVITQPVSDTECQYVTRWVL
jgi:hypothetical protein